MGVQSLTNTYGIYLRSEPKICINKVCVITSQAWLNGRLHAPYHRVMMSGDMARYSIGLFSIPKGGYMIKAPDELVDEAHPLLFKPFDHVQFLGFYYTEAGQKAESALKAYCGVQN